MQNTELSSFMVNAPGHLPQTAAGLFLDAAYLRVGRERPHYGAVPTFFLTELMQR